MRGAVPIAIGLFLAIVPASAQQIVTSPGPDSVSVTIYRAPERDADAGIDRDDPAGFALITERRTIALPAGPSVVRFEGVAGNIFPETAIVAGLPQDVREKNLDADLLSPRSLYDRALGRRVMLRRTNPATGKIMVEQAVIRSAADGAAILQLAGGFEALRCSGLPEALVYDGIPSGLSAKPTLSIATDSASAHRVTMTLSYLAGGFDWQADYVVRMRRDGRSADLFAWITLASNDVTSFVGAGTQVVAGKTNRTSDWSNFGEYSSDTLALRCLPVAEAPLPPPPAVAAPAPMAAMEAQDIVVTGSRRHEAVQEELGDYKLYRLADPVTVASKAQKQVAMLAKDAVPMTVVYVSEVEDDNVEGPVLTLRAKNRVADGLGLPLPAGQVAVFEGEARPSLIGESATDDKAIGEDVEFKLGETAGVSAASEAIGRDGRRRRYRLTVSNANARPIVFEARLRGGRPRGAALVKRGDVMVWTTNVPANGTATLNY